MKQKNQIVNEKRINIKDENKTRNTKSEIQLENQKYISQT